MKGMVRGVRGGGREGLLDKGTEVGYEGHSALGPGRREDAHGEGEGQGKGKEGSHP